MPGSDREGLLAERRIRHRWGSVRQERLDPLLDLALGSVLDVGCSRGDYVRALQSYGHVAAGIDVLEDAAWTSDPPFIAGDATALPFPDGSFDTIISFETLEHVTDAVAVVAEWRRVARRQVVLSVPNSDVPVVLQSAGLTYHQYVDRTHVQFFDDGRLRQLLLDGGFAAVQISKILPIHPFVLFLDAIGAPPRLAAGLGRRLTRLTVRRRYTTLFAVASIQ